MPRSRSKRTRAGRGPQRARRAAADDLRIALRRERVVELKAAGASFAKIGKELGCSDVTALNDYHAVLNTTIDRTDDCMDRYREQERIRLEHALLDLNRQMRVRRNRRLIRTVKVKAANGKPERITQVVTEPLAFDEYRRGLETRIKISQRLSALLGLDAPIKVTPKDISETRPYHEWTAQQISDRLTEIDKLLGPHVPGTVVEGEVVAEEPSGSGNGGQPTRS